MYTIVYTKKAIKDIDKLKSSRLDKKARSLIELINNDPYKSPPIFEKLLGNLEGLHSRRINLQHRLVYQVYEDEQTIKILSIWSHYDL